MSGRGWLVPGRGRRGIVPAPGARSGQTSRTGQGTLLTTNRVWPGRASVGPTGCGPRPGPAPAGRLRGGGHHLPFDAAAATHQIGGPAEALAGRGQHLFGGLGKFLLDVGTHRVATAQQSGDAPRTTSPRSSATTWTSVNSASAGAIARPDPPRFPRRRRPPRPGPSCRRRRRRLAVASPSPSRRLVHAAARPGRQWPDELAWCLRDRMLTDLVVAHRTRRGRIDRTCRRRYPARPVRSAG